MGEDGKRTVIEDVSRDMLLESGRPKDAAPPAEKKVPAGCVERVFTMRDRNLIIGACIGFCGRDGHRGLKDQEKLRRVRKLLGFDETLEYFAMIDDALEERVARWKAAQARYRVWRDWRSGVIRTDELKREYPALELDPEKSPEKPPVQEPEKTPEELRGPERAFAIPAKLDAWIEEALRGAEWTTAMNDGALEVSAKYDIEGLQTSAEPEGA